MESEIVTKADEVRITEELGKFVFYLAHNNEDDLVGMEFDDIVQELNLELIKGIRYYQDRNLNESQTKAVLKRILDNRISELRYKYYVTYRQRYQTQISIDVNVEIVNVLRSHCDNPAAIYESGDIVRQTRNKLTDISKKIFDAVIFSDDKITRDMLVTNIDRKAKMGNIAEALEMKETVVRKSFWEIRTAYREVCCGI